MRFEGGKTVGPWTLVSDVDTKLAAPLWIGDDGDHVAYLRNYRVRSIDVTRRLAKVVDWARAYEHNNLLPMLGIEEVPGGVAVISTYEEGQPLSSLLARARLTRRPMPAPVATALALDMLAGLHAMGGRLTPAWAHGGLRPEAVLITRAGRARLMEVGITATLVKEEPLSQDPGWVAYAAPEQLGTERVTSRSDVFSVASILWEMLVGRRLFDGRDRAGIERKLRAATTSKRPDEASDDVPKALSTVVAQALERDDDDRYPNVTELETAVKAAADAVAEPFEVSKYLETLQVVTLDKRRRVIQGATGRVAPMSMPPPPKKPGSSVSPGPDRATTELSKVGLSSIPPAMQPSEPKPQVRPKPKEPYKPKPAVSVAPRPVTVPPRPGGSLRPALNLAPQPAPPDLPDESEVSAAPPSEPPPSEPPVSEGAPSLSEDVRFSEAGEGAPSLSEDVRFSEAGEGAPSLSEDVRFSEAGEGAPSLSEDVRFSDEGVDAPPSSVDVQLSEAGSSSPPEDSGPAPEDDEAAAREDEGAPAPEDDEAAPASEDAVGGTAPAADADQGDTSSMVAPSSEPSTEPSPKPISPPPAAATLPTGGDLLLDEPDLTMRPPRRWPIFLVGFVVGSFATFAATQAGLLPGAPASPAPTASESAAPGAPRMLPELRPPEPEPVPDSGDGGTENADDTDKPAKEPKPRPRPRPGPPPPTKRPPPAKPPSASPPNSDIYD